MRNRIDELMAHRDWSYERLAQQVQRATGVETSRTQMSRLAKGKRRLTDHWIDLVARAFGVPGREILPQGAGLGGSDATWIAEKDLREIELRQAQLLYPEGRADTLVIESFALIDAGYRPGDRILVDLTRAPKPGDAVVIQIHDDDVDTARTALRVYRPPVLVPASANPCFSMYESGDNHVAVKGVIVGRYWSLAFGPTAA